MTKNQVNNKTTRTGKIYNLASAFLAFILWGAWAYYINGGYGLKTRIVSGIAQGTASFMITLFMIHTVTWLFYHLSNAYLQLILPAMLTVIFTGSCLAFIHYFVGTPNIVYTITPALSVAFIFCLFTTFKLKRVKYSMEEIKIE